MTFSTAIMAILGGAVALACLYALVNHFTSGRLGNYFRTALTGVGRRLEDAENPADGLQRIADQMRTQVGDATQALIGGEAQVRTLTARIADRKRAITETEAALKRLTDQGVSDTDPTVLSYANRLARESAALEVDEAALASQIEANAAFTAELQDGIDTIDETEAHARQIGVQLKMAEAQEAQAEARMRFNTNGLRGSEDAAKRYMEKAKERLAKAGAAQTVAAKLEGVEAKMAREEKQARGAAMLASLKAKWKAEKSAPAGS